MSRRALELRKGSRLQYEIGGDTQLGTVVGFTDDFDVVLRHRDGTLSKHCLSSLLAAEGTIVFDEGHAPTPERGTGLILQSLEATEIEALEKAEADVLEVLTGYPFPFDPCHPPSEPPREPYGSGGLMTRYRAKAAELGLHWQTVRGRCVRYREEGIEALVDKRGTTRGTPLVNVDVRWADAARSTLIEIAAKGSRISARQAIQRVKATVATTHPGETVLIPKEWTARRALKELDRGINALDGQSMKNVRSNLNRPAGVYGRLRADRPGELVLLDTTRLDVHGLERFTNKWVPIEVTVALDLYSRSPVGLTCRAVSTKTTDVFDVVYESCAPSGSGASLWQGIPATFVVDETKAVYKPNGGPRLGPDSVLTGQRLHDEPVTPENLVVDRGRVYVSHATRTMCRDLGIGLWPCRAFTPTDKSAVERFFRTLREQLVEYLDGYTGPDVYSRGENVEGQAVYFIDEIEVIIRSWIREVYMNTPHSGIALPEAPGARLTPAEAMHIGQKIRGSVRVPATPNVLLAFLPIHWRTIQHYGVEVDGLIYNGTALNTFRNVRSGQRGRVGVRGKYAFRRDPRDVRRLWFEDPDEPGTWHQLWWTAATRFPQPFGAEVVRMARQIMRNDGRLPDVETALAELLARFKKQARLSPTERRVALQRQIHLEEIFEPVANPDDEASVAADPEAATQASPPSGHPFTRTQPKEDDVEDLDASRHATGENPEDDTSEGDPTDDEFYRDRLEVT